MDEGNTKKVPDTCRLRGLLKHSAVTLGHLNVILLPGLLARQRLIEAIVSTTSLYCNASGTYLSKVEVPIQAAGPRDCGRGYTWQKIRVPTEQLNVKPLELGRWIR